MRVTLRIDATSEQVEALVAEWLHHGNIRIQTSNADMDVRLTYVKEG